MSEEKVVCVGCGNDCPKEYIVAKDGNDKRLCVACTILDAIDFGLKNGWRVGQGVTGFDERDKPKLYYHLVDLVKYFNGGWAVYYP